MFVVVDVVIICM